MAGVWKLSSTSVLVRAGETRYKVDFDRTGVPPSGTGIIGFSIRMATLLAWYSRRDGTWTVRVTKRPDKRAKSREVARWSFPTRDDAWVKANEVIDELVEGTESWDVDLDARGGRP